MPESVLSSTSRQQAGSEGMTSELSSQKTLTVPLATWLALGCIGIGNMSIGYSMTAVSPIMNWVSAEFGLSTASRALLGSSALFGNLFGSPIGGILADRLGRKAAIIMAWSLNVICALASSLSPSFIFLIVARFVIGMTTGAHYASITPYISEVLDESRMETVMYCTEIMFFVGSFLSMAAGYGVGSLISDKYVWRVIAGLSMIPMSFAVAYFFLFASESPVYSSKKAVKKQIKLKSQDVGAPKSKITDKDVLRNIVFVGLFWACASTPGYCFGAFSVSIIESLKVASNADMVNSLLGLGGVVGVVLGMRLIKIIGTKSTMLAAFLLAFASMLVLTILRYMYLSQSRAVQIISMGLLLMFNLTSNIAAPLCLVYPGKLFPSDVKGLASGICAMAARLGCIILLFALSYALSYLSTEQLLMCLTIALLIFFALNAYMSPTDAQLQEIYENNQKLDKQNAQLQSVAIC